jgi:hypothetical protein
LKLIAIRLGILGFNTTPGEVIDYIIKAIGLINAGVDFFVNPPDVDRQVFPFGNFTGEVPVFGVVTLEADLHVEFTGVTLGQNYQDFVPVVRFRVKGGTVASGSITITTKAGGVLQDRILLNLAWQNLNGAPPLGPATAEDSSPQGLELTRTLAYGIGNLTSVDFAQQGIARVEYGINGANLSIALEASVAGTLMSGIPFALKASVKKYGLSV